MINRPQRYSAAVNLFQEGFTLIEILVGSAILGMMMLIMTSALRVGADSWEAGEERLVRANRLFITQGFLKRHISTLLPLTSANPQGGMDPAVKGYPNAMIYIAPLPDQLEGGGLYQFNLYLSVNEENQTVRMTITPYTSTNQANQDPPKPLDDVVILDQASNLNISYFGIPQSQGNLQMINGQPQAIWMDEWREYQLPLLIRIDMGRVNEPPWPTIFIAPKTQSLR